MGLGRHAVEILGDALEAVQGLALLGGNERHDDVLMTDRFRRVERRAPLVGRKRLDVRRRRRQAVVIEQGLHVRRGLPEVARELDLLVARRGHLGDRRVEIFLHLVPHRVQLQPDAVELAAGGSGIGARGSGLQPDPQRRRTECPYEIAPISHVSFPP